MAAEVAVEHPSMANHRQVKRTQARPKHSLFGTTLENVDQSELRNIDPSSAHNIGIKKKPERYPVPADMQNLLSARALIQKQQGDISSQNRKVADADNELKQKQLKALGFTPDPQGKPVTKTREGEWLSPKDLEHSSDINSVGLGKSKSYNRDRYGQKPPTHSYALIGDVLGKGNEFGHPQKYDPDDSVVAQNRSQNNNSDMIRLGFNPPVDPDIEAPLKKGSLSLPPNIRHKFGSKECDKLMEDHTAVRACLEKERRSKPFVRPKFDVDTKGYTEKAQSGNYFDVGHVMRYNIWPGHTPLDLGSTFNSIHNDVVYLRREPMSDEHRMIKDAYAAWAEQNLVREKLKKQWNAPKDAPSKVL